MKIKIVTAVKYIAQIATSPSNYYHPGRPPDYGRPIVSDLYARFSPDRQ